MNMMIESVRVTRRKGMVNKIELLDFEGDTVAELPATAVDFHYPANAPAQVSFSMHGSRVEVTDVLERA